MRVMEEQPRGGEGEGKDEEDETHPSKVRQSACRFNLKKKIYIYGATTKIHCNASPHPLSIFKTQLHIFHCDVNKIQI